MYLINHVHIIFILFFSVLYTSHLYPLPPPPTLRGWARIVTNVFTFQSPGISPSLWGQAGGNNPTLVPALHY